MCFEPEQTLEEAHKSLVEDLPTFRTMESLLNDKRATQVLFPDSKNHEKLRDRFMENGLPYTKSKIQALKVSNKSEVPQDKHPTASVIVGVDVDNTKGREVHMLDWKAFCPKGYDKVTVVLAIKHLAKLFADPSGVLELPEGVQIRSLGIDVGDDDDLPAGQLNSTTSAFVGLLHTIIIELLEA